MKTSFFIALITLAISVDAAPTPQGVGVIPVGATDGFPDHFNDIPGIGEGFGEIPWPFGHVTHGTTFRTDSTSVGTPSFISDGGNGGIPLPDDCEDPSSAGGIHVDDPYSGGVSISPTDGIHVGGPAAYGTNIPVGGFNPPSAADINPPSAVGVNPFPIVGTNPPSAVGVNPPPVVSVNPFPIVRTNPPSAVGVNPPSAVGVNPPSAVGVNPPPVVSVNPFPVVGANPHDAHDHTVNGTDILSTHSPTDGVNPPPVGDPNSPSTGVFPHRTHGTNIPSTHVPTDGVNPSSLGSPNPPSAGGVNPSHEIHGHSVDGAHIHSTNSSTGAKPPFPHSTHIPSANDTDVLSTASQASGRIIPTAIPDHPAVNGEILPSVVNSFVAPTSTFDIPSSTQVPASAFDTPATDATIASAATNGASDAADGEMDRSNAGKTTR